MTPDPLERLAAEALPCVTNDDCRGHAHTGCPATWRPEVLQALRAARRLGAEEMRDALAGDMHALSAVVGDHVLRRDFAWKVAADRVERHPLPDPEPTESER